MTAERAELHELIDELPDDQLEPVIADVRRRLPQEARSRPWPPAFFGIIKSAKNGRTDNARRVDEILAEGFGRPRS